MYHNIDQKVVNLNMEGKNNNILLRAENAAEILPHNENTQKKESRALSFDLRALSINVPLEEILPIKARTTIKGECLQFLKVFGWVQMQKSICFLRKYYKDIDSPLV